MGLGCLSCSVPDCCTGCCLKRGGSQSASLILSPTACLFCLKNKLGGQGLSLPIHLHTAQHNGVVISVGLGVLPVILLLLLNNNR